MPIANNKGFTLIEIIIVVVVLAILALTAYPLSSRRMDTIRAESTVEEMIAIAIASERARRLPGGNAFIAVSTSVIGNILNVNNMNPTNISAVNPQQNYWGGNFIVTTNGPNTVVATTIPVANIFPMKSQATSVGPNTILRVQYKSSPNVASVLSSSESTKHILYLE